MALNKSKGNMYEFVTHTWNTIKGQCFHDCSYCYCKAIAKRFNSPQKPVNFDEKELKTKLGSGNFIFVGSSCDMFAKNIPDLWIQETLNHCRKFDNEYLFQTKNPGSIKGLLEQMIFPDKIRVCTTIETNRFIPEIMGNSPTPNTRAMDMNEIAHKGIKTYVTIEPIIDFDLDEMVYLIETCLPEQVNIGANSGNIKLPEPSKEKILALISKLQKFTTIHNKSNLKRLLK